MVRPALETLVADGAIVRIKGSGAFVAPPRLEVPVLGLVEALTDRPDNLTLTVLTAREEPPDPPIAHFLEMEEQSRPRIAHVTAVLHVDGLPVCLVESYSPAKLVPWLLPTVQALKAGAELPKPGRLVLGRATVSIELTSFGRWEGPQVGVSAGDPALMGRLIQFGRTNGDMRERPLEFVYLACRSDNAQLVTEPG